MIWLIYVLDLQSFTSFAHPTKSSLRNQSVLEIYVLCIQVIKLYKNISPPETVEEASRYESELKDLRKSNERLESEIVELRSHLHSTHEAPLLAAPGAMISTLARRVASQLGADSSPPAQPPAAPPSSSTSDNLEESMRKVNKYVGTIRTSSLSLDLVFHYIWICF